MSTQSLYHLIIKTDVFLRQTTMKAENIPLHIHIYTFIKNMSTCDASKVPRIFRNMFY